MPNNNKLEKQIEIEKEMINMLVQKNQEKINSEMFKNALIKERYSQKKKASILEKNRKSSKNFQIKSTNKENKSIFCQTQEEKKQIKIDEKGLDEKIKTKTQPTEKLIQTFP